MPESRQHPPRVENDPADPAAVKAAAALAAWQRGESAMADGDLRGALSWFDRAHRLAPQQDRITLSLAMALLRAGAREAILLLTDIATRHDLKAVWLALAAAQREAGERAPAAASLARALSGHAWTREETRAREVLDRVAAEAGFRGWCALGADGTLLVGGGEIRRQAATLDGRALARRRLPRGWERAGVLAVAAGGEALLGSPIRISLIRRTEGFVACGAAGLAGWAWHPGEPDREPLLGVGPAGALKPAFTIRAKEAGVRLAEAAPLARPRGFAIPAARLSGFAGAISIRDRDGRELAGSPLDPRLEAEGAAALVRAIAGLVPLAPQRRSGARSRDAIVAAASVAADATAVRVRRSAGRRRPVDIVVPVHGGMSATLQCLASVRRHLPADARIIVVDDASPEPLLSEALQEMAAAGAIRLLRQERGRGFPAACNAAVRATRPGADILFLNSDTRVTAGWLSGLQAAALSAPDIATATPLSNDATIVSYPEPWQPNPAPDEPEAEKLGKLAASLYRGRAVEIPTGVGFCLYVRRACLEEVGLFRAAFFAQGYGEENDFCLRARHLGWRHVAAPGVYVAHIGGQSFGAVGPELRRRNLSILNRLHPGYDALIAKHRATDPLFPFRRRLDAARFAAGRQAGAVLLITHARGGGVEKLVRARAASLRGEGLRPIVLSPAGSAGSAREVLVGEPETVALPNLRFSIPEELDVLSRLLRKEAPGRCEVHHLVGHDHRILELCRRLKIPYDVWLHDYASFCARIALVGPERHYCGEPELAVCAACIADAGSEIEEELTPAALVRRSDAELRAARRVIAPSGDTAERITRHFPGLSVSVAPWEDDTVLPAPAPRRFGHPRNVAVIGAIGTAKGYEVLLAMAREAAWSERALRFVLIGYSRDDRRLLETGRVFVTGAYRPEELPHLIARERVDFAFLPSLWPEPWCFTLSEAWQAGLDVAAFDLGAPAARIRATGRGWLLPLGLSAAVLNNALLNVKPLAHG